MNPLVAGLLASWCVAIISVWVVYPTPRMQPPALAAADPRLRPLRRRSHPS
jgi:hypothetical protein